MCSIYFSPHYTMLLFLFLEGTVHHYFIVRIIKKCPFCWGMEGHTERDTTSTPGNTLKGMVNKRAVFLLNSMSEEVTEGHRQDALIYLMGSYARNYRGSRQSESCLKRVFHDENAALRFREAVFLQRGRWMRLPEEGILYHIKDQKFVQKLSASLGDHFEDIVNTERDHQLFLQGFFDASKIKVHERKTGGQYIIVLDDEGTMKKVLKSFFELGIYPYTDGVRTVINGQLNLRRLYDLKLDQNDRNREVMARTLLKKGSTYSPQLFYEVRSCIREIFEKGDKPVYDQLARQWEIGKNVLREWVADIAQEYGGLKMFTARKPKIVHAYEELLNILGFANPYTRERIFIPVGDTTYEISCEAQAAYLRESDDRKKGSLDAEDRGYLADEIAKHFHGTAYEKDLMLNVEGTVVVDIRYPRCPRGANRFGMRKDYIGIRLGGKGTAQPTLLEEMSGVAGSDGRVRERMRIDYAYESLEPMNAAPGEMK